jgi:hypothetical protein
MPQLDFAGNMNFWMSGGQRTNQLRGTVITKNGMVGDAHGSFFKPGAQELGGVVLFNPAVDNDSFMGAFGMRSSNSGSDPRTPIGVSPRRHSAGPAID